jgi:lipopolysaccharide/colanic/teichoic acid biosynthesis glycosyltransferase
MREGAEKETGPVWASDSDERVTRLGRILRRFRLDEIPQFVNIIRGDMSLVGPRPERPELVAELEKTVPFYRERENVMPGLTGWAQIRYGYGNTTEDAARKLEYDLYYMKHLSFALDLQILLSTLQIVLFGAEKGE